jgi:hypothetical protein
MVGFAPHLHIPARGDGGLATCASYSNAALAHHDSIVLPEVAFDDNTTFGTLETIGVVSAP